MVRVLISAEEGDGRRSRRRRRVKKGAFVILAWWLRRRTRSVSQLAVVVEERIEVGQSIGVVERRRKEKIGSEG